MMTSIFVDDLKATQALFEGLLGFETEFVADWFICLQAPDGGQLGLLQRHSEFIPQADQLPPQGMMVTVVVDDVATIYQQAQQLQLNIVEPPRDLPYGQRRLLIRDASGLLIDISQSIAPIDPRYR